METDESGEHLDDTARPNAAGHIDREAFTGELIDDGQALERAAIGAGVEDEVVRPDVIDRRRRQWARPSGGEAPPWPPFRHLQRGMAPESIRPLGTEHMPLTLQEDADLAVAVPGILTSELAHCPHDRRVAHAEPRNIAERRARDRQQGARAAARQTA